MANVSERQQQLYNLIDVFDHTRASERVQAAVEARNLAYGSVSSFLYLGTYARCVKLL